MTAAAKRGYESPLRDEQARATRRAIVAAAAELFIAQGYAATTIDAIAKAANVSRKTVFAAGGSKFALLKDAYDWSLVGDDEPIPMADREPVQRIIATSDPARAVRTVGGDDHRDGHPGSPDRRGAGRRRTCRPRMRRPCCALSDRHRLEGARAFVDHLASIGGLRPGLSRAEAADLCWLAMDPAPTCGWWSSAAGRRRASGAG